MAVNVTFVIQVANFWVSYYMMHKLIFSPIMHILQRKESAKKLLLESLKDREHSLRILQDEKQKNASDFKTYLTTRYVTEPLSLQDIPSITVQAQDHQALEAMTAKMCNLIVTKASNAY
jgi:hypothetical protein